MVKINIRRHFAHPGWSLIDAILSIAVVALLGLLVAGLSSIADSNSRAVHSLAAGSLTAEELTAAQRLDIANLPDQTNGTPVNMLYNAGSWSIVTDSNSLDAVSSPCPPPTVGKHCGANVIELPASTSFANKESGRLQLPADSYDDATIQASWRIGSNSPSSWVFGLYFRMRDTKNGYRLRLGSPTTDFQAGGAVQNVILEKISNGTVSTLYLSSGNVSIPTNTWMAIRLVMSGNTFTVTKDGSSLVPATADAGSTFSAGHVALVGWNGVHAEVDDVSTVDPSTCSTNATKCWDFESESILPTAWTRFGINNLPDSTSTTFDDNMLVTVEPWPASATDLKRVTIVVSWTEKNGPLSITTVGYVRDKGLGL